jgi:hypothetical protein
LNELRDVIEDARRLCALRPHLIAACRQLVTSTCAGIDEGVSKDIGTGTGTDTSTSTGTEISRGIVSE